MNAVVYFWGEIIPNWIVAISALGAFATFLWRKQDRMEAREADRRNVLSGVSASWVVVSGDGDKKRRGILVENRLPVRISELKVPCVSNKRPATLGKKQLEPGAWFFESIKTGFGYTEALPEQPRPDYVSNTNSHKINAVSFVYEGETYNRAG